MINRTVTFAKQHTPNSLRVAVRRAMLEAENTRLRLIVPVAQRCEYENIFHCTVHKTASQWIKAILRDPIVYRHSGLLPYDPRFYKWRHPQALPPGRTVTPLFVSYNRFKTIPKSDNHRAFFVLRDPRDIVVSSYYSLRDSHAPMGDIPTIRKVLRQEPRKEGLLDVIKYLSKKGLFASLRSWQTAPPDGTFRLFRQEDLTGEGQLAQMDLLMRHCGIHIPTAELETLLARYSFAKMRKKPQSTGPVSHYRKGKSGDWRNYFDDDVQEAFVAATGDLVDRLGYPKIPTILELSGDKSRNTA